MSKPIIHVWDTVGLGIVIEYPTGVMISNQTGGTACLHPKCEGIYVPLANDYNEEAKTFLSPEIELSNYFRGAKYSGIGATNGIDLEDVKIINQILSITRLSQFIAIDLERLDESHEAWVRIKISNTKDIDVLHGFDNYPLNGVLTWANSD